jgi:pimeloyl-ACP methyl ester carboxylesterase
MESVISKDGTVIRYIRVGSGRPVLFVHGTMADHKSWLKFSDHIKQFVTVYAIDRRGRFGSQDSKDYDIMREAEDVAAVVESIGEPVVLFGHSFGGLCCLEATLLTDRVSHLILYEPMIPGTAPIPDGVLEQIQNLIDRSKYESAVELFMREIARIPEDELEMYRNTPLWEPRLSMAPTIPREMSVDKNYRFNAERFEQLKIPCLLLVGGDSPDVNHAEVEIVDQALPNSQIDILTGQQHMAHHTKPELLAGALLKFLKGQNVTV